MARLNEPTAQVESVEALKRRFVRQNREIARVNSTQSLRIRSLESEVSRLLSENLTLREHIIKLQFEIDNNVGPDSISMVKGSLEAKLVELENLVQQLGSLQRNTEDRRTVRRSFGMKSSPKKSPAQKNWKNALNISEPTATDDGRLPPIVEGKYYPRRTLDADEMLELLPNNGDPADSPDLGPPPIAHFEAGDPIQFDTIQQETPRITTLETSGGLNPAVLANLETRRKKRGSSHPGEKELAVADPSDLPKSQQEELNKQAKSGAILKSGAKRKFSAREDDECVGSLAPERNDFQYSQFQQSPPNDDIERENLADEGKEQQAEREASAEPKKVIEKTRGRPKGVSSSAISNRSILAPKSVNTDPVSSPVKNRKAAEGEKVAKLDVSKTRERNRMRDQPASQRLARPAKAAPSEAPEAIEAKPSQHNPEASSSLALKTPAPLPFDTFSPDGSDPPVLRPEGRDTPPPADLDPESANISAFGSLGRASRRQRGSVSYAEPNLRDKMRRPTKELVDAVGADDRLKDKKTTKSEADPLDPDPVALGDAPSKMRTVFIKKENAADDSVDWKMLPSKGHESERDRIRVEAPGPLGSKAAAVKTDLPPSVVTERRRRPSILDRERFTGEARSQESGSRSAITASMTEKPRSRPQESNVQVEQPAEATKPIKAPDIYDVQKSSPAETENARTRETKPAVVRTSRRHSSVTDDRIKEALARRAERRKEAPSETRASGKVPGPLDLKSVRRSATVTVEAGDGLQGRGERAASRRKSMML